jgi:septal ring factor EnvC (AmiA/AmiB activator)
VSGGLPSKLAGAVAAVALAHSLLSEASFAATDSTGGKLGDLRDAILDSRERVGRYELRERELLDRLEQVDRALGAAREELRQSRSRARRASATLDRVEAENAELTLRLAQTQRAMSARVVALYKTGEIGPVRVLFSASSLPELLSHSSALRALVSHDGDLVARHRRERAALDVVQRQASAASGELDEALAATQHQTSRLSREQTSKLQLLSGVRGDRSQERALLIELETAARALEETIAMLGKAPRRRSKAFEGSGFAALRGRLPMPVEAEIQSGFGRVVDARFQTETFSKGVEFDAPLGESVRAVAMGEVRYAGWFRGYGRIAILDHGDGYFTVFGHLERVDVEVGDWVEPGGAIGIVGETGSLSGPSLYFEIRKGSRPLDPADWLMETLRS